MEELRKAAAAVAERARFVQLDYQQIPLYAVSLPLEELEDDDEIVEGDPKVTEGSREEVTAFWVTLNAINFGSGWFPTLNKRPGKSGYFTVAAGIRDRFGAHGRWHADQLAVLDATDIAEVLGQDPHHDLMRLYAHSLRDLGTHLQNEFNGRFSNLVGAAKGSAIELAERLGEWDSFADFSRYEELELPFLKRAQITAADLARAGMAEFGDIGRLTMFADNLVPHVLRLDGILSFDPGLVERIERGDLIVHGSREEVEIRACALHAVEQIVGSVTGQTAAAIDEVLWQRGQDRRYKSVPRYRCRCTAY
jgi:hypothetical protein